MATWGEIVATLRASGATNYDCSVMVGFIEQLGGSIKGSTGKYWTNASMTRFCDRLFAYFIRPMIFVKPTSTAAYWL